MKGICGNISNILRAGPCNSSLSSPDGIPEQIIFIKESTELRSCRDSFAVREVCQATPKHLSPDSPEKSSEKSSCADLESSFLTGSATPHVWLKEG